MAAGLMAAVRRAAARRAAACREERRDEWPPLAETEVEPEFVAIEEKRLSPAEDRPPLLVLPLLVDP